MSHNRFNAALTVDSIKYVKGGELFAEPYLWTVFFKIDGTSIRVLPSSRLEGLPVVRPTPGSHGNLDADSVTVGQQIGVPSRIGTWETGMIPIPLPPELFSFAKHEHISGTVGVAVVLMEEDNISDLGAEAGHAALNHGINDALREIVRTRDFSNQGITDEEIARFSTDIRTKIRDAVIQHQTLLENIWSAINKDDQIGFSVIRASHNELFDEGEITFNEQYENGSEWEIAGRFTMIQLAELTYSHEGLDFGIVPVRDIRTRSLTIENRSNRDFTVTVSPSTHPFFTWNAGTFAVPEAEDRVIVVDFAPKASGPAKDSFTITPDFGQAQRVDVAGRARRGETN